MTGHQPLLDLRRRGAKPALGVRIDCGHIDPLASFLWRREQRAMAVVWVPGADQPAQLDLRFVRALPSLLVVDAATEQARLDELAQALWAQSPASLTVLHLAASFRDEESAWVPVDAYEITATGHEDRNPALTYAKAFS